MHMEFGSEQSFFSLRAVLMSDRLVVGILGFLAFVALQRGAHKHAVALACSAAIGAILLASRYAETAIPASVLTAVVAAVTAALVAGWPGHHTLLERVAYACVVVAGCLALTNFLTFHDWGPAKTDGTSDVRFSAVNYNDMFHYYLGAKYARELGYNGLYVCAAQAGEKLGFVHSDQPARDLRTNELVTVEYILSHSADCRTNFTAARWRNFTDDMVTFFREAVARPGVRYITDFGYNATPFETALNRSIVAWTRAKPSTLGALAAIDAVLFVVCIALITWAFGPRAGALASLSWGVGAMWVYNHVGLPGSLGRLWWLTALIAGVCLAKRGRFGSSGIALATAAALRAFPFVFLAWPAVLAGGQLLRKRAMGGELKHFLVGATAGSAVIGAVSVAIVDSPVRTYLAFLRNSQKLVTSGISNFMGLEPMLNAGAESVLWWLGAVALGGAAAVACRRLELAHALVLSGLCGMFILFPMPNYSYVAAVLLAPFVLPPHGQSGLAGLLAFGGFVLLGNVIFVMGFGNNWFIYQGESQLTYLALGFFAIHWMFATKPRAASVLI
jgi:hypothetical protein